MITAIGLGALIGILLGLLGGGGSILAVPALVHGAGLTLAAAVPTSLLVVGISSATALLPRLRTGLVRWRIAAIVGGTGATAAFAGAAVNRLLDPRLVLTGFAALMVIAGWRAGNPGLGLRPWRRTTRACGSIARTIVSTGPTEIFTSRIPRMGWRA